MQNKLIFGTTEVIDDKLYGGVRYEININPAENLTPGTVACSRVEFITDYFSTTAAAISQSFLYKVKMIDEGDYSTVNKYTILEAEKVASGKIKCVAYDDIYKFDNLLADGVVSSLKTQSGATIVSLFSALCTAAGLNTLQTYSTAFPNANVPLSSTMEVKNVSAREMLGYIAQAAGGFICSTYNEVLNRSDITVYNYRKVSNIVPSPDITITRSDYKSINYSEKVAPQITAVKIAKSEDDIGRTVGTDSGRTLGIYYNPLFMNTTDEATIDLYAEKVLDAVKSNGYRPVDLTLFSTNGIKPYGTNSFSFTVKDSTNTYQSIPFNISWDSTGVYIKSTANNNEALYGTAEDSAIKGLQGKYNTLSRTVESTVSTVGDLQTQTETAITQSANAVTVAATADGKASEAKATADGLSTRVTTAEGEASEALQTANGFSQRITDAEGNITTINTTLQGVAYTSSLAAGTTTINGGCITTGTLSADRIAANSITANKINGVNASVIASSSSNQCTTLYSNSVYTPYIEMQAGSGSSVFKVKLDGAYVTAVDSDGTEYSKTWYGIVTSSGGGTAVFG